MEENQNPLVTVIIPSYNHAQYILNAIESVKTQTFTDWEMIVIDDGSTDNSHEVLKSMPVDSRIRLILHTDNKRQSARFNEAISEAKGKYISFLSSDDWYLPEKLEKQVTLFETLDETYGVVYSGGSRYFEEKKNTLEAETNQNMRRGWILKELLTEPFFIYPISPMVKKSCFERYLFDSSYTAEGEAIYFKIAMKYQFDYVDETLVVMRDHGYNIGKDIGRMLEENVRYRKELFEHPDFPDEIKPILPQLLSNIYKLKGWEYIRLKKEYKKGRKALLNAIRCNKSLFFDKRVIIGLLLSILPQSIASKIN